MLVGAGTPSSTVWGTGWGPVIPQVSGGPRSGPPSPLQPGTCALLPLRPSSGAEGGWEAAWGLPSRRRLGPGLALLGRRGRGGGYFYLLPAARRQEVRGRQMWEPGSWSGRSWTGGGGGRGGGPAGRIPGLGPSLFPAAPASPPRPPLPHLVGGTPAGHRPPGCSQALGAQAGGRAPLPALGTPGSPRSEAPLTAPPATAIVYPSAAS